MQVFLMELINNFEFGMTKEASNVIRVPLFVMVAMIKSAPLKEDF